MRSNWQVLSISHLLLGWFPGLCNNHRCERIIAHSFPVNAQVGRTVPSDWREKLPPGRRGYPGHASDSHHQKQELDIETASIASISQRYIILQRTAAGVRQLYKIQNITVQLPVKLILPSSF